jgi:hypothetical protein
MPCCLMDVHRRLGGIRLPHPKVNTHSAGGKKTCEISAHLNPATLRHIQKQEIVIIMNIRVL